VGWHGESAKHRVESGRRINHNGIARLAGDMIHISSLGTMKYCPKSNGKWKGKKRLKVDMCNFEVQADWS
jgi:hypothetical protein